MCWGAEARRGGDRAFSFFVASVIYDDLSGLSFPFCWKIEKDCFGAAGSFLL